jgi:hypothetical protein
MNGASHCCFVARDALKQPEPVCVDGPDEGRAKPVKRIRTEPIFHPGRDPSLQLIGSLLGESERGNSPWIDLLGDDLCLLGTGGGDDLDV